MSIKRMLCLITLCLLFTGCATQHYEGLDVLSTKEGDSTTLMGVRYLLGRGVKQDDERAFYYFNKAAADGNPFAQNEVAYLYAAGKGTPRDYTKAFAWYKEAAENGLVSAQYNLGLFYLYGLGTKANKSLAKQWIKKAATRGFAPARLTLAKLS